MKNLLDPEYLNMGGNRHFYKAQPAADLTHELLPRTFYAELQEVNLINY